MAMGTVERKFRLEGMTQELFLAVMAAQKAAGELEIVRSREVKTNSGKRMYQFSSTETWIRQCRKLLQDNGLVASQESEVRCLNPEDPARPLSNVMTVLFTIAHPASGGWITRVFEWPIYSSGNSPGHSTASTLTTAWKYFLRGFLMIPQVDDSDELEAFDEGVRRTGQANEVPAEPPQASQPIQQPYQPAPYPQHQPQLTWQPGPGAFPPPQQPFQAPQQPPQPYAPPAQPWQQAPLQQQAAPPTVYHEPVVQHAQQTLQSDLVPPKHAPPPAGTGKHHEAGTPPNPSQDRSQAPPRDTPVDGGPDYTSADLIKLGWREDFAAEVDAQPTNNEISDSLKEAFFVLVNDYFGQDMNAAFALWQGTGYVPQGKGGPKPTGVQLRRYCARMNWLQKQPQTTGGVS